MSLDSILVPSVVRVSVPFTELHEHAYLYCSRCGTLFTNKLWESCCEIYSTIVPNIVCISLFISELQEYASSHCSLLWYEKSIVYQQIIKTVVSNH